MDTFNQIMDGIANAANFGSQVADFFNKILSYIPKLVELFERSTSFFSSLVGGGSFNISSITKLFGG
jgi:hypothetical protein